MTSVNISVLDEDAKLKAIAELASGEVSDESLRLAKTLIG
jgi:DNA repair ATPase RecN